MKNLIVGLCDNEKVILDKLKQIVSKCFVDKRIEFELITVQSGSELLKKALLYDVVFLDIEMLVEEGIQTGEQLKKLNSNCKIIIATGMVEKFKEAFKINAVRFATKPFDINEISEAIDCVLSRMVGMDTIELYRGRIMYSIQHRDIKYVLAFDSYTEFKAGNEMYRNKASLNTVEQILDNRIFFRVNKQYIINFMWIEKYKDGMIQIEEEKIRVSRRKKREFEKAYMEYDINYR